MSAPRATELRRRQGCPRDFARAVPLRDGGLKGMTEGIVRLRLPMRYPESLVVAADLLPQVARAVADAQLPRTQWPWKYVVSPPLAEMN